MEKGNKIWDAQNVVSQIVLYFSIYYIETKCIMGGGWGNINWDA